MQVHAAADAKSTTCQQSSCEDGFVGVYTASDVTYPQPGSTSVRKHKEKKVVKYKHYIGSRGKETKTKTLKKNTEPRKEGQISISGRFIGRYTATRDGLLSPPAAEEKREMKLSHPHCPRGGAHTSDKPSS